MRRFASLQRTLALPRSSKVCSIACQSAYLRILLFFMSSIVKLLESISFFISLSLSNISSQLPWNQKDVLFGYFVSWSFDCDDSKCYLSVWPFYWSLLTLCRDSLVSACLLHRISQKSKMLWSYLVFNIPDSTVSSLWTLMSRLLWKSVKELSRESRA